MRVQEITRPWCGCTCMSRPVMRRTPNFNLPHQVSPRNLLCKQFINFALGPGTCPVIDIDHGRCCHCGDGPRAVSRCCASCKLRCAGYNIICTKPSKSLAFFASANVALHLEGALHRSSCMLLTVVDQQCVWILPIKEKVKIQQI